MAAGCVPRDSLETRDLIRKALMGLSEEHRTAIILKEYLGLNLEEVARVMDLPPVDRQVPVVSRPERGAAQSCYDSAFVHDAGSQEIRYAMR